jgi:hypothetical protein
MRHRDGEITLGPLEECGAIRSLNFHDQKPTASPLLAVDSLCRHCESGERSCLAERQILTRKAAEMRRVALTLIVALFALPVGAVSASAAPIEVKAEPGDGGVTVTATVTTPDGTGTETIKTGSSP